MIRNWRSLLKSRFARTRPSLARRKKRRSTAHVEQLEGRCLLSSISVIPTDPLAMEGASTGTLVFSRDGDLSQALSLSYSTGGTATSGVDYVTLPGIVTIPAGLASAAVVVKPLDDGAADGTEVLSVTLAAQGGYTVDLGTAEVSIRDEFDGAQVGGLLPLSETFELHSLPNARHRVYLDFNGGTISDNGTKTIQPYNSDGVSGFSDAEKAEIQQIWSFIAEDLRPWQVDVTTKQPDIEQLRNTGGGDQEWGLRVTIGEDSGNLTAPGRSGVGIFDASTDQNNWGVRQGNPEDTAGLLTHEIGHALGLDHDGTSSVEYYDGHGSGEVAWGTYMGSAYQAIVQWDRGQYPGANNQEDDLNIIATTNGFSYRPDDHGNSATTATALLDLGNGILLGEGIIETNTDFDLFSFTAASGPTRIFIDPPANSSNIDIKAELLDASLTVVATSDVTDQLAATFDETLTAGGTYFVRVTGTGNRTWNTNGYDDYGSLGSYAVQVGGFGTVASFVPDAGQNSNPIVGTSLFSDVTLSSLTRTGVGGGTNGAATWPLHWSGAGSQDLGEYISFTATPDNGRLLDVNELSVNFGFVAANATVAVRSSVGGFAANIDGTRTLTSGTGTLTFDVSSVADSSSAVEFRVYLWGGGSGWRDLNSLSLEGRTIGDSTPSVDPQYIVNHHPRLQLGDAPLDGYAGSALDQIAILWQTQSAGSGTQDSFTVENRLANSGNAWQSSGAISQINTGSGTRIVHEVEITGLQWDTDYEYRVRHLRDGGLVEEWTDTFKTRLQAGDTSNFSFVAYGDSAKITANTGFRSVQNRINQTNAEFSVLLGDNIYEDGTHGESDARFDADLNPEAAEWMASHVDYLGLGNHDVRTGSGSPSENNFAVPIPTAGVDSPVAPPNSERPEHNFSWDYGDVHFVTFDTNAWNDTSRRDALLDYVIADLNASDARWKIVYGHHPIAAAPDKVGEWDSTTGRAYYDDVVDRFTTAGVDLLLTGHSHTFSWTHPLTGRDGSGDITHDHGDHDAFGTDLGLVQVISGLGGKNVRTGSHSTRLYVAAGWTSSEEFVDGVVNPTSQRGEDGFAKIDVTQDTLTISYIAADDGATIGSFTISQAEDTTGPTGDLHSPADNDANDLAPDTGEILVNQTRAAIDVSLHDATGINDATVTSATVSLSRDGNALTVGTDYTFSYDAAADEITLTSVGGNFGNGVYVVTLSGGASKIADTLGNAMTSQTVGFEIDTTITPPVTVSFRDGVDSYTGTVDTKVRSNSPTTDFSSDVALEVDSSSAKQSLLRFDNIFGSGTGQIPAGATIQSATLEFTAFDSGDDLHLHRMVSAWTGASTWDSLTNGVQADGNEAASTADATLGGSTGTQSIDVKAALQAWLADPASNRGWAILPSGSNGVDIHSSEATTVTNRPKLTVTYIANNQPTNNAPVAVNDSANTDEGTATTINVLGNDTDADLDPLTAELLTQPTNGTATLNGNGTVTYTPTGNFNGNDSFTYRVNDGELDSNTATVNISVAPVNDAPVAVDDVFSTDFETLLEVNETNGVLGNDIDVDRDALTATIVSQPSNGTVSLNDNGSFSYTPDPGFVGDDSFTYSVSDGVESSEGTVTITVESVDDHGETTDSTATAITLSGGDSGTGADSGTFEITGDRDMFRIAVSDGELSIDLDGINGLDTYLRVYDSSGTQIASNDDGGPGLSSALTISVAPGTYYISAGSYADAYQGDFTISVDHIGDDHADAPGSNATSIALSDGDHGTGSSTGSLETAGDRDVFQVQVTAGELAVSLTGVSGLDTYLRLYDGSGTQIASNDDGGPGLNSALTISVTAGTYYISAGSYSDLFAGDYSVGVALGTVGTSTFQQGVNGYTDSTDTFLSGDHPTQDFGGWTVSEIDLSSSGDHEHSLLRFDNIFGSGSGQIPFGSEITSATLTFYVSNGGNPVSIHRMLVPWTDSATWNSFGSGIQANNIEAWATADLVTTSLSSGWRELDVTNSLTAWAADPSSNFGWVLLPTGSNGVDFYSTNNVSYWVPRISVEYLAASGDLHSNTPDSSATVIDLSSGSASMSGTLETAGDRDVFAVTFTETVTLTIDLGWTGYNNSVDTYLRLFNASGSEIASDDDSGSGTSTNNSRLTITLGPGTYYVSAGSYDDDDVGDFELDLSVEL